MKHLNAFKIYLWGILVILVVYATEENVFPTTFFNVYGKVIAVIEWPANSPEILAGMFRSKLWPKKIIKESEVSYIDVILYNMDQLRFEGNDIPKTKKNNLIDSATVVAFDWSTAIAFYSIGMQNANKIIESLKVETTHYLKAVIIGQGSAGKENPDRKEFNSFLPPYVTARPPDLEEWEEVDEETSEEKDEEISTKKKRNRFVCLGGYSKPHKIFFLAELNKRGYLNQHVAWSSGSLNTAIWGNYHKVLQSRFDEEETDMTFEEFDKFTALLPKIIDVDPTLSRQDEMAINYNVYTRGHIHLIIESEDNSPEVSKCDFQVRFTEKTIKAIFLGFPFLVYGNFGTLEALRSYGFKTFHPIIDESYDLIPNRRDRINALIKEVGRLIEMDKFDFEMIMDGLKNIARFNQNHLRSKDLKRMVRDQAAFALGLSDFSPINTDKLANYVNRAFRDLGLDCVF